MIGLVLSLAFVWHCTIYRAAFTALRDLISWGDDEVDLLLLGSGLGKGVCGKFTWIVTNLFLHVC